MWEQVIGIDGSGRWPESDLPFDGTKRSGTELGVASIQQFLNQKLIRG